MQHQTQRLLQGQMIIHSCSGNYWATSDGQRLFEATPEDISLIQDLYTQGAVCLTKTEKFIIFSKKTMQNRTTPEHIDTPLPGQIPVVGTNLAGIPGKGAALWADKNCEGGMKDVTFGFNSHETAFGIPTKDEKIKTMPLDKIRVQVDKFIGWANLWSKARPDEVFLVTPIGCGLAGYTPEQIAPMFAEAVELENVHLPASFWRVLNQK